jgi:hypothetical protein
MPLIPFKTSPYWDDYDAAKQFYHILARPGYALQAREISQLQTILQEQIKRFGQHVFQEGSMVIPGQITFDQNMPYVKVNATFSSAPVNYDLFDPDLITTGVILQGATTAVLAQVVKVNRINNTVYVKYLTSGTTNTTTKFQDNEILKIASSNTNVCQAIVSASTGVTSAASIQDGVYFVFGRFVNVYSQTILLADFDANPSVRVGLLAVESLVTPEDDPSLNENATGTPNFAAPGAHRYKIELVLTKLSTSDPADENFVELMRINAGVVEKQVETTLYSEIEKVMARRQMDANGNFIVRPFKLDLHEHLLSGANEGIYTSGQGGDEAKLALGVEPGKAYVLGHEIQTIAKQYINLDKARDTAYFPNSHTRAYLGNYIFINRLFGVPSYESWPKVSLYETPIVTDGVAPGTAIGTAVVRGLEYAQGTFQNVGQPGPIFRCFVTDINITTAGKTLANVRSFSVSDGTLTTTSNVLNQVDIVNVVGSFAVGSTITGAGLTETVYAWDTTNNLLLTLPAAGAIPANTPISSSSTGTANILARNNIFDTEDNILVYSLPHATVSSVRDTSASITTTYSYRKTFSPVAESAGRVTFSTGVNEVFGSVSITDFVATIETGTGAGKLIDVTAGSPTLASGLTQLSFNAPSGTTVKLSATVSKSIAAERTKTLTTQALSIASAVPTVINLGRADVYRIIGVWQGTNNTGLNITDRYTFDNGQRDARYDLGTLTLRQGEPSPSQVYIEFEYFTHGSGDYFCVNSYTNFGSYTDWYSRIPYYQAGNGTLLALRDCLDFRQRVDDTTWPPLSAVPNAPTYTGVGKLVKPNDDVISDFSYYLGRIDKVYLDENGFFQVVKGTPAIAPLAPSDPPVGMVIAVLSYGAYTFSPKFVSIKLIPNRVYTMADIGKLETRIEHLEYYTALNLLEQQTASFSIPDSVTGLDRFKSGFLVDPFTDTNIVDSSNSDTQFAIDPFSRILRPTYNSEGIDMQFVTGQSSNYELNSVEAV